MSFSIEQQKVYDLAMSQNNLFISGPGGSGKSYLIKKIYEELSTRGKQIELTALTGVAAVQLHPNAKTIHSWAGIGLGDLELEKYLTKINSSKALKNKWNKVDVLIIDEVSMMTDQLFELLNNIAMKIRRSSNYFGGIQIIISGDFYQLPPVKNKSKFCFESKLFNEIFKNKILLSTIFRQTDESLLKILQNIRLGKITNNDIKKLQSRILKDEKNIKSIILMPKKNSVDEINKTKLEELDSPSIIFNKKIIESLEVTKEEDEYLKMLSVSEYNQELEYLQNSTAILESIELKVGAQVMSIINIMENEKLVISNGTQGIIKKFLNNLPYVEFENGINRVIGLYVWKSHSIPCCGTEQIPLILSWALTIHKAQGSTLTKCRMNIGDEIFEAGQTYVALSRVKSLDGIYLDSFNPNKIKINTKVKNFYDYL